MITSIFLFSTPRSSMGNNYGQSRQEAADDAGDAWRSILSDPNTSQMLQGLIDSCVKRTMEAQRITGNNFQTQQQQPGPPPIAQSNKTPYPSTAWPQPSSSQQQWFWYQQMQEMPSSIPPAQHQQLQPSAQHQSIDASGEPLIPLPLSE